jgi:hypothetical protein
MSNKFNTGQLRGAYSAGFEQGFKQGAERMQREGWAKAKEGDTFIEGEIVKTLVPTMSGWIGLGRVIRADGSGVQLLALDKFNSGCNNRVVDLCVHEVARKINFES